MWINYYAGLSKATVREIYAALLKNHKPLL
jgi:hypothetical protein